MELIFGFLLGIISSVLASFLFQWITAIYTFEKQRKIVAFISNPILFVRLRFETEERNVSDLIHKLFQSWCEKDLESYLSCWSDDCIRIFGNDFEYKENKSDIEKKFLNSCIKYSQIKVPINVIEEIDFSEDLSRAKVSVYYKFDLVRASDMLPVTEHSKEVYILTKNENRWVIVSNIDYLTSVTKKNQESDGRKIKNTKKITAPKSITKKR